MHYASVKTASEIKLDGITVSFDKANDTLRGVYLRDGKGNHCRIVIDSYSLCAHIPAPPKKETRYILRGELPAVGPVEKQFKEKYEADRAKDEMQSAFRGDLDLTISKEDVEIKDDAKADTNDLPF